MVASTLSEHLQTFGAVVEAGTLRRSQLTDFLAHGREAVALLERNTVRAADLIGHFKQVAVDQTSVRRRRFNLRQTVEEVLATLGPTFKRTAHRVEVKIPPDLELDSYPGPLEQIIANLIGNSLTHGFAGDGGRPRRDHRAVGGAGDALRSATGIMEAAFRSPYKPVSSSPSSPPGWGKAEAGWDSTSSTIW